MEYDVMYLGDDLDFVTPLPSPSPAASPDTGIVVIPSPVPEEGFSSDEFVHNVTTDQNTEPDPNLQTEILFDDSVIITKLDQIHIDLMLVICVLVLLLSRSILSAYRRKSSRR